MNASRRSTAWFGVLALPLLLVGCSVSASLTVPASQVADAAERALEKQVGSRPNVDCGAGSVKLVDGTKVDCKLVDPKTGSEFDTTVVLSDVKGTKYSVDVQVASDPNGAPASPTATPTSAPPSTDSNALTVTGAALADTAAGALTSQYGSRPTVTCADSTVALIVGAQYECDVVVDATGARGTGTITITEVNGSKYSIDVKVVDKK